MSFKNLSKVTRIFDDKLMPMKKKK